MQCSREASGHYANIKQWTSSQIWPDISLKWLELSVVQLLSWALCMVVKFRITIHVWTFLLLSTIYIRPFLYYEQNIYTWSMMFWHEVSILWVFHYFTFHSYFAFCTIVQCYLWFSNTASSLFLWHNCSHFGILLSTPVKSSDQVIQKRMTKQ